MLDAIKITSKFKAVSPGFPAIKPSFNDYTWAEIKQISDAELWDFYGFEVGDKKAVNVNYGGASGEVYCFITDFNHNYKLEGKGISLEFGLKNGKYVTMGDTKMRGSDTNSGGWKNSYAESQCTTFFNALPSDLQAVIKEITKYSNNDGTNNSIGAITATKEKIFIPDAFEIVKTTTKPWLNFFALNFQTQYRFYQSANASNKYKRQNLTEQSEYWLRSSAISKNEYLAVSYSGEISSALATEFKGLAFMFVV